jgi:hypothetical protein
VLFLQKSIYNSADGEFDASDMRYQMLFSFDNLYGIFSPDSEEDGAEHYSLQYVKAHDSVIPDDVLKDVLYLVRAGKITMSINDIVSIKINGTVSDFRFLGFRNKDPEKSSDNFAVTKGFLTEERMQYVVDLHNSNKILSVLDGKVYSVSDAGLQKKTFYCIDSEAFQSSDRALRIRSDYFLYTLKNMNIKEVNPYRKPFGTIKQALYYYTKSQKANANAILLFNRQELEMVKDYCELHSLVL